MSIMKKFTMIFLVLVPYSIVIGSVTLPSGMSENIENHTKRIVIDLRG